MSHADPAIRVHRPVAAAALAATIAIACGSDGASPPPGADLARSGTADMSSVVFDDVAADIGLDFRHSAFRWGLSADLPAMMGGGLCWIDVDRDGWLDLFVVDTWSDGEWGEWRRNGGLPTSRLFRNNRGQFDDATQESGAGLEMRGGGCVAADLDRDGWTDLYVTSDRANRLLWNEGGTFAEGAGPAGVDTSGWQTGAAAADVDGDGRTDLFVAGYADTNRPIPEATKGFPNTFAPEPDLLFVNDSAGLDGRPIFREMAAPAGVEVAGPDYGLGPVFTDVDRDGDLDLYVANDTNPNRLYLNTSRPGRPQLTDAGGPAGVDDPNAGMGVAAGDFDGDGGADLVVTNLDVQGHRIFRHIADDGSVTYEDALSSAGLASLLEGTTGWGTTWADLDLDGDLDLVVVNGAVPVRDLDEDRQPVTVLENRSEEGGLFVDAGHTTGIAELGPYLGRGLAAADYDNDGDTDLAIASIGSPLALLRNTGAGGHWLGVAVDPATPGTRVTITMTDGSRQTRELHAGSSYLSSEDPRALFGVGSADTVARVYAEWPDGTSATVHDVGVDEYVAVASG